MVDRSTSWNAFMLDIKLRCLVLAVLSKLLCNRGSIWHNATYQIFKLSVDLILVLHGELLALARVTASVYRYKAYTRTAQNFAVMLRAVLLLTMES